MMRSLSCFSHLAALCIISPIGRSGFGEKIHILFQSANAVMKVFFFVFSFVYVIWRVRKWCKLRLSGMSEEEIAVRAKKAKARWAIIEPKLRSVVSFIQIVLTITATCIINFPVNFQNVLAAFAVINFDLLPFGVVCW